MVVRIKELPPDLIGSSGPTPAAGPVARRDPAQQQYTAAGDPVVLAPQQDAPQMQKQVQTDSNYFYPVDGGSNEPRYPAPRGRRLYDTQVYQQQPEYDRRVYAPRYPAQVYVPEPYQPRW